MGDWRIDGTEATWSGSASLTPASQPASKQIQQSHFRARYKGDIRIGMVANGASTGYTRRLIMTVSMMISWSNPAIRL